MSLEEKPERMSDVDWYIANMNFRQFFFITIGLSLLAAAGTVVILVLLYNIAMNIFIR